MTTQLITGVFPPMITPFKGNGDLDLDAHRYNVEKWNEDELAGYVILGSNSETTLLEPEEKRLLIEMTARYRQKDRWLIAGTGMESTRATIQMTTLAASLDVDAALVITPSFYPGQLNEEVLRAHFLRVADAAPIPIILYNVPKFTNVNIPVELVVELARHQNIIGIKDSSGNIGQMARLKSLLGERFNILAGTASVWFPALTLGVSGGIMALANCLPNECSLIRQLYEQGAHAENARDWYNRILPVNEAVTAKFGVAGLKYACEVAGYKAGLPRLPYQPLTPEQKTYIDKLFKAINLFKQ